MPLIYPSVNPTTNETPVNLCLRCRKKAEDTCLFIRNKAGSFVSECDSYTQLLGERPELERKLVILERSRELRRK